MPENKNLKKTDFPMEIRFGEAPKTTFVNNLHNINVKLINSPSMEDLRNYLVDFATATWEDNPFHSFRQGMTKADRDRIIYMILKGKMLPSALETVRLTFLVQGIAYQDLSHILRYRRGTFSVECSADKWWSHKNVVVPSSIENSPEFYERYKKLHLEAKQLYVDMVDSKEVSLLDARMVLTRAMETYCWVSVDLATAIGFIKDRIDKQIQPESDNIIAYGMLLELIETYPLIAELIDIKAPAMFYVNTARTGRSTNLYIPDEDSDIYEWNKEDYLYQRTRAEVNGTDKEKAKDNYPFREIFNTVKYLLEVTREENREKYGKEFFEV